MSAAGLPSPSPETLSQGCRGPGDRDDEPHWSIDFWVDDVDAVARKAGELGGSVVVAPYDTPIARQAILADPQGAIFSVSKVRVPTQPPGKQS
jgi:predicted enzyme related to lactoylglutathione lyase